MTIKIQPIKSIEVVNPMNFGASGRGEVTTTGSITSGTNTLTITYPTTWNVGMGIAIAGAGAAGAVLVTKVTAISGSTFTLRNNASTTVTLAAVTHSDHEAIQDAINACMYSGNLESQPVLGEVYIPGGVYNLYETINVGYGETFKSCHIRGAGGKFTGTWDFAGTALVSKKGDRPCVAISGGRTITIDDLSIVGLNRNWVESRGLGGLTGTYADINTTDWVDTALTSAYPNCNSRYAPYAGVAIDPYAGGEPTPKYPDQPIPAWMSNQDQYGKSYTSNVKFRNVFIEGFVVGCVVQPSGADGNGDYIGFENSYLIYNVYGFSIGNSQARLMNFDNCVLGSNHTSVTSGTHGTQTGKPALVFNNCELGANIRWFYLPTLSYGGCATFNHCYCELSYKLGEGVEASSAPSPLTFNNCEISLTAAVHGVAQYVVKNNGPTIFNSSIISINPMPAGMETYPFHMHFDVPSNQLELNGCSLGVGIGADTNCKKQSIAGTGGISCSNLGVEIKGNWTVGNRWNLTTGSSSALSPVFSNDTYISNRAHCIPIYAKRVRNTLLPGRDQGFFARSEVFPAQKDSAYMGYGVSGGISISPSGRTITISNIYDAMFNVAPVMGGMPGDIAYDGTTKTQLSKFINLACELPMLNP